jgi:hypothetical protein
MQANVSRASLDRQSTRQAWDGASIAVTYMTWRGCRYRRLIWGLIKRSLCWFLALLKPIVKVPKVIVAFLTLLKLVKFAKPIIVLREVVCSIVLLFLRFIDVECVLVRGLVGFYERPNRGSWRPFFRQWYAGRHQGNALRTFGLALRGLWCLDDDVGLGVCEA